MWIGPDTGRKRDSDTSSEGDDTTHFGFQKVPVAEKVNRVRSHFDRVAGTYDILNTLLSFGIHYYWKRRAVNLLALKQGDRVIDVCGGTGDLSILATRKVDPTGRVVLYDMNRSMMTAGRDKSTNAAARKMISYVQGDAERISFRSGTFDAAIVGFGIRNLTHMEEGLKEMYRVLRPGGRFVCLEFSKPTAPLFRQLYDFYSFHVMPFIGLLFTGSRQAYTYLPESIRLFPSPTELAAKLEGIGFRKVTYLPLTNGIAVVHTGRKP